MASITIDNVVKTFGQSRAVDNVSLEIKKNELFFLLGPSGCGKTTLLRMIAGFYYPESGRILFDDEDVSTVAPHKRQTGMVFQNYALWPHMTVRQNVTFGLEMRRVPSGEHQERVDRTLEMVQMLEYTDRSPNQLSGGQQQRIAVARALVLEPDVVLLDEPLSNLDAKLRLDLRAQIKSIHERLGLTMVYVTHDQSEALSMADRIAVMRGGQVSQIGTPKEVYHRPQSRFVADFIGQTNLIQGQVETINENVSVQTAAGRLTSVVPFEGIKSGDSVYCSIRPEQLEVLPDHASRPNVLTGQIIRTFFLGDHEQYYVRLVDGTELKAVEHDVPFPGADIPQTARLGCDCEDIVLLPADD